MKRQQFEIHQDGKHVATCSAWNAARRKVVELVRSVARSKDSKYERHYTVSERDEYGYHIESVEIWIGKNGDSVRFEIKKVS